MEPIVSLRCPGTALQLHVCMHVLLFNCGNSITFALRPANTCFNFKNKSVTCSLDSASAQTQLHLAQSSFANHVKLCKQGPKYAFASRTVIYICILSSPGVSFLKSQIESLDPHRRFLKKHPSKGYSIRHPKCLINPFVSFHYYSLKSPLAFKSKIYRF